jgi:hypothetical protein
VNFGFGSLQAPTPPTSETINPSANMPNLRRLDRIDMQPKLDGAGRVVN